jgi:hypothetical protein
LESHNEAHIASKSGPEMHVESAQHELDEQSSPGEAQEPPLPDESLPAEPLLVASLPFESPDPELGSTQIPPSQTRSPLQSLSVWQTSPSSLSLDPQAPSEKPQSDTRSRGVNSREPDQFNFVGLSVRIDGADMVCLQDKCDAKTGQRARRASHCVRTPPFTARASAFCGIWRFYVPLPGGMPHC